MDTDAARQHAIESMLAQQTLMANSEQKIEGRAAICDPYTVEIRPLRGDFWPKRRFCRQDFTFHRAAL